MTQSLSSSPKCTFAPSVVVSSPTTSTPNKSPSKSSYLPESPPNRSPHPLNWTYSDPSADNSARASVLIVSASSSPLVSPSKECSVITANPSYSEGRTRSPPTALRSLLPGFSAKSRSRSPLLGISALKAFTAQASQHSLDWDNYGSSPTFFGRNLIIPIISTPSTSLDSSPEKDPIQSSVIMSVRRCTGCHRYISGAPKPELEHVGRYGPDYQGEHHPAPCDYIHLELGGCTRHERNHGPPPGLAPAQGIKPKPTDPPQFVQ